MKPFVISFLEAFYPPAPPALSSSEWAQEYNLVKELIPVVIQSAIARRAIPVYGDGMNVRDWLYVRDHAEALWPVLTRGRNGATYNIGGHNEWPNLRTVELI